MSWDVKMGRLNDSKNGHFGQIIAFGHLMAIKSNNQFQMYYQLFNCGSFMGVIWFWKRTFF
eukprot:UN07371